MKYLITILLIFATSLIANPQGNKNKTEDTKLQKACISGDAVACYSLGNIYSDLSNNKGNIFLGALLYKKACRLKNEESCKTINEFKSKNFKSLLGDNEIKILNVLIKDELIVFLQGSEPSSFFKDYHNSKREHINTTANDIQLDYEKNEVGADLKYKNKDIVISGEVIRISKDAFDSIYLDLKGGTNQFMTPKAYIVKDYLEWASKLLKKDKIKLYCEKSSMVMGSAILNNCKPLDIVIDEKTNNIIELADKKAINTLDEKWLLMGFAVKESSKILKNNSKCYTSNNLNACIKDLESINSRIKQDFVSLKGLIE